MDPVALGLLLLLTAYGARRLWGWAYSPMAGRPEAGLLAGQRSTTPNPFPGNPGYRYPFTPYPQGWFFAVKSAALRNGKAVPLSILGKDLVAWRDGAGVAVVMDAHCPHLGAHLGYGGSVGSDGCLACPFHGWRFDREGKVAEIPYSDSELPKSPLIQTYRVCEKNTCVFIWNGSDSEPDDLFEVPDAPEMTDPSFAAYEQRWRCRVHVQEVVENALDTTHFNVTHAFHTVPVIQAFATERKLFRVHMTVMRTFLWIHDQVSLVITYHGMGVVTAHIDSRFLKLRVLLCGTPLDAEHVEINTFSRFEKTGNPFRDLLFRLYLPFHTGRDFYADLPIWENKAYRSKPLLVKGDGPIPAIRRWCRQFYGKGKDLNF